MALLVVVDRSGMAVVEDEPVMRDMLTEKLRYEGHQVTVAGNGQNGAAIYRSLWRDLDLVMPEMNGRDCYRARRQINPVVAVILSSDYSVGGEAQSKIAEGVRGFIQNPSAKRNCCG